jgi:catechol 2,3-dioxygenase-like lactoylglutathione lyase family enzyme
MEEAISNLVSSYERGALSRRELIQGITVLAASVVAPSAAKSQEKVSGVFESTFIDHVSIQASNVEKTVQFYQNIFGLPLLNQDKTTTRLKVGDGRLAIRSMQPYGTVDHYALHVKPFDKAAATEACKKYGVTLIDGTEPLLVHAMDPDGYPVQLISRA